MTVWKALLLVYEGIDVPEAGGRWWRRRFRYRLSEEEIADAVMSFERFPGLVEELTDGRAMVTGAVERITRTLCSLGENGSAGRWPSPDETRLELDRLAPSGAYDSVFVFWPQNDFARERSIESGGWGLGMGASAWSNGMTYAAVGNAPGYAWRVPRIGEVWLHEWLHGVCAYFRALGHAMPEGDADGGDRHGYVQSPTDGWMAFYRDLVNASVREPDELKGIRPEGWLLAGPRAAESQAGCLTRPTGILPDGDDVRG